MAVLMVASSAIITKQNLVVSDRLYTFAQYTWDIRLLLLLDFFYISKTGPLGSIIWKLNETFFIGLVNLNSEKDHDKQWFH